MTPTSTTCPKCGQGKFKVVDGARCVVCDNVVQLTSKDKCRHREDGMIHCTSCDRTEHEGHPSYNLDDADYQGVRQE